MNKQSNAARHAPARTGLTWGVLSIVAAATVLVPRATLGAPGSPSMGAPMIPTPKPLTPTPALPAIPTPVPGMQLLPHVGSTQGIGSVPPKASNPVPGVDIVVRKKPGGVPFIVHTDGTGTFTLGMLTSGEYTIELSANSLRSAIDKLDQKPIDLTAGTQGQPGIIALLVALLLPAVPTIKSNTETGSSSGSTLVEHRFREDVLKQGLQLKFTIPENAFPTTIDWGDGTTPANVAREGTFVESPSETPTGELKKRKHSYRGTFTLVR